MAKNAVSDWSTTPASNTDIAGISIVGSAPVNNFDDAMRNMMSQIKAGVLLNTGGTVSGNFAFDMSTERNISFSNAYLFGNTTSGGTIGIVSTVNAKSPWVYTTTGDLLSFNSPISTANQTVNGNITFNVTTERRMLFSSAYMFADLVNSGIVGFYSTANAQDIWRYRNDTNTLSLATNTTIGGSQVVTAATTGANMAAVALDTVGKLAFMYNNSASTFGAGSTTAGSNLIYSSAAGVERLGSPTGNWRCLGRCKPSGNGADSVTLWEKIS